MVAITTKTYKILLRTGPQKIGTRERAGFVKVGNQTLVDLKEVDLTRENFSNLQE